MKQDRIKELIHCLQERNFTRKDQEDLQSFFFSFPSELETEVDGFLVLTSQAMKRIEKAVELYHQQPKPIFISGTNDALKDGMLEQERYFLYAICHGVKEEDLFLEDQSRNTYENILFSLRLLQRQKMNTVALITSSQHMPRVLATLRKIQKEEQTSLTFYPCVSYATSVPKDSWFLSSKDCAIMQGELERFLRYHLVEYAN